MGSTRTTPSLAHNATPRSSTFMVLLLAVTPLLVKSAAAQMVVPSSWRKPTVNLTRQEAIDIAAAALDRAYAEVVPGDANRDFNMILTELDIATNQTRYKDKVTSYFTYNANTKAHQTAYNALDPIYGYAAALAYVAYNTSAYLDIATAAWDSNNKYVLPDTGIPAAFQNTSDSKIVQNAWDDYRKCPNSKDLSGGLMHYPKVDMITSENARFFRLSVLLSQITKNTTYLDAAQQSARLLLSYYYTEDSLFAWNIALNMSEPCEAPVTTRTEPWNVGYAIESLAILSSINHNETINDRLIATLSASSNYAQWHESQGILKQEDAIDIVRGFATVQAHEESFNANTSSYVESYLAVQYNAVLDKATVSGTNVYGSSWIGPPNSTYSADSQLTAARVLIAGISLASQIEPTPAPSETPSPNTNVGAIVGGTIGGLFFVALIVVGLHFIIRRYRQHTLSQSTEVMQAYPRSVADSEEISYYLNSSEVTVSETWTPSMGYVWQSEKLRGKMHVANPSHSQSDVSNF